MGSLRAAEEYRVLEENVSIYGKQVDSVWNQKAQRWFMGEGKANCKGGNNAIERKDNWGLEITVRKTRAHTPDGESPLPLLSFRA